MKRTLIVVAVVAGLWAGRASADEGQMAVESGEIQLCSAQPDPEGIVQPMPVTCCCNTANGICCAEMYFCGGGPIPGCICNMAAPEE